MKNFMMMLFGTAILAGHEPSKQFFLASLKYSLYIATMIAIFFLEAFSNFLEKEDYEDVLNIYFSLPYTAVRHFRTYSEPFFICGYIMLMVGFMNTLMSCKKKK